MPARHSLGVAFDALCANPLRTLLSALGMVIGVGSLVAILSLGDGLEAFTRHEIEATTDLHMIQVAPVMTERVADVLLRRRDVTLFTPTDEADLAARLGQDGDVGLALSYATFWKVPGDLERGGREHGGRRHGGPSRCDSFTAAGRTAWSAGGTRAKPHDTRP